MILKMNSNSKITSLTRQFYENILGISPASLKSVLSIYCSDIINNQFCKQGVFKMYNNAIFVIRDIKRTRTGSQKTVFILWSDRRSTICD